MYTQEARVPIEKLDADHVAKTAAAMLPPREPRKPSLNDLPRLEDELEGLNERARHCDRMSALLRPELARLQSELKAKRSALDHVGSLAASGALRAETRHMVDDMESQIHRLEEEIEATRERLEAAEKIGKQARRHIKDLPWRSDLEELRKAQKLIDAAHAASGV